MYAISGHYGTGKTVLASEAVKMILSKLKKSTKDVDVHVLTFGGGGSSSDMKYELLMKDLKNKCFLDQAVNVQHFADFLKKFTEEHKNHLTPKQLKDLNYPQEAKYYSGGDHFKGVLITICEMMKKFNKTSIILIDELELDLACRKTKKHGKMFCHFQYFFCRYDTG